MKNKKTLLAILCGIGIALVTLVLLIPFFYTLLLSLQDYSPLRGLFGSRLVGFNHFVSFFSGPYFLKLLKNSILISLLGTVVGAAYAYLASVAIASSKNSFLKATLTMLFVIPAIIPVTLFRTLFPTQFLVSPSLLLTLFVSVLDGIRLAGLVTFAAFFLKGNAFKEGLRCMLLFIAIRLIGLLTNNTELIFGIYHPATYEVLDVFSTYAHRTGIMSADFSLSAAAHITKTVLQFFPAVLACVILILINKTDDKETSLSEIRFLPAAVFAVIPLALLITILITGGSLLPAGETAMVMTGYLFEFLYAFLSALLVTVVAYLLALASRYSKIVGCIALTVLALTAGSLIGPYLMIRSFSLLNTVLGPVFLNMSMVPVLALVLSFALHRENNLKSNITAFIFGFIMTFSNFWGSCLNSTIAISEQRMQPLSLILKRVLSYFSIEHSAVMQEGRIPFAPVPLSTVPYILIPLLVVGLGLLLCAIIYIIKTKKKAQ
ncbi:MAG: hypothetical protein E7400_07830 [Ruminococcaceae bacterium]|nr:hypothetical protein [Oscillospiraceae bacterium]